MRGGFAVNAPRSLNGQTLLHCAVYAGVPAAIDAFRAAQEVLDEVFELRLPTGTKLACAGLSWDDPPSA